MSNLLEKSFKVDLIKFYLLFAFTIFTVYYTPNIFSQLVFLVFLVFFYNSNKDYFWMAFIFILFVEPNGFFSGRLFSEFQRIPIYSFGKNFSFAFFDLFFIATFIKILMKRKRKKIILSKPLLILLGFLIFSYLYSIVLGMSLTNHIQTIRSWMPFILFFALPSFMDEEKDYFKFMYLLFPMMLFVLFGQIFQLVFGIKIASLLIRDSNLVAVLSDIPEYEGLIRVINASYLNFFCLLFSLFILNLKNKKYNKYYIYIVLSSCIFSIYLSATRGWIIAYIVILLLYFLFVERNISSILGKFATFAIFLLVLLQFFPILRKQTENSTDRLMTMKALIKGDVTAQGTLSRLNVRGPKVLKKYWENPILGLGVSDEAYDTWDGHVGNQSFLLEAGIIGYLIFIYYLYSLFSISFRIEKKISKNNILKNSLYIFAIVLFGLFIIHSSSTQMFGLIAKQRTSFMITLLFLFYHFFIEAIINKEKELRNSKLKTEFAPAR